jgi:hypothetical protein
VTHNALGAEKTIMKCFTALQLKDLEGLAATSFDNDVIYTVLSEKYKDVTWERRWFAKQVRGAKTRHLHNSPSANAQLQEARDTMRNEGGTLEFFFDGSGRIKSVFIQTAMMRAASAAYGLVRQVIRRSGEAQAWTLPQVRETRCPALDDATDGPFRSCLDSL